MKPVLLALLLAVFLPAAAHAHSAQSANDGGAGVPSKPVHWVAVYTPLIIVVIT